MTDNGTMLLDKVEIPHRKPPVHSVTFSLANAAIHLAVNFLARYAKIDPQSGQYEKPPNAKLSYGTMCVSTSY